MFWRKKKNPEKSIPEKQAEYGYSAQTIAKKLQAIRQEFESCASMSDEETKNRLVEPFLKAFGWNKVERQFREPDYKLFANDGYDNTPIIIIVKKYGSEQLTEDNLAKLAKCCEAEHAQIAILTNGVYYHFFTAENGKLVTDKCYTFDLTKRTNLAGTSSSNNSLLVDYFVYEKFHQDSQNRARLKRAIAERAEPIYLYPF